MKKAIFAASILTLTLAYPAIAQTADPAGAEAAKTQQNETMRSKDAEPATSPAQPPDTRMKTEMKDETAATGEKPGDKSENAPTTDQARASTTSNQWRASNLIGLSIVNSANDTIGDINDLIIADDGRVAAVVVGVGGFLGIGEKNVSLPFDELTFRRGEGGRLVAVSAASKNALEAMPAWTASDNR